MFGSLSIASLGSLIAANYDSYGWLIFFENAANISAAIGPLILFYVRIMNP